MKNKYTSLELSKKLKEGGCELEATNYFVERDCCGEEGIVISDDLYIWEAEDAINTYDLLWDICIKYVKEFFGDKIHSDVNYYMLFIPKIFKFLQQNKKQEAEDYIWENCLFNNKNKEK